MNYELIDAIFTAAMPRVYEIINNFTSPDHINAIFENYEDTSSIAFNFSDEVILYKVKKLIGYGYLDIIFVSYRAVLERLAKDPHRPDLRDRLVSYMDIAHYLCERGLRTRNLKSLDPFFDIFMSAYITENSAEQLVEPLIKVMNSCGFDLLQRRSFNISLQPALTNATLSQALHTPILMMLSCIKTEQDYLIKLQQFTNKNRLSLEVSQQALRYALNKDYPELALWLLDEGLTTTKQIDYNEYAETNGLVTPKRQDLEEALKIYALDKSKVVKGKKVIEIFRADYQLSQAGFSALSIVGKLQAIFYRRIKKGLFSDVKSLMTEYLPADVQILAQKRNLIEKITNDSSFALLTVFHHFEHKFNLPDTILENISALLLGDKATEDVMSVVNRVDNRPISSKTPESAPSLNYYNHFILKSSVKDKSISKNDIVDAFQTQKAYRAMANFGQKIAF